VKFAILRLAIAWAACAGVLKAQSATTQADIPANQSTPRGALRVLAAAIDTGDGATIRAVFQTTNPQEQKLVDSRVSYSDAVAKFGKAAVEVFGPEEARKLTGDQAAAQAESLRALQAMPEHIEADTATVGADKQTQIHLTLVDGKWKVAVDLLTQSVSASEIQKVIDDMLIQAQIFTDVTAEMLNDKFKSVEDASDAIQRMRLKVAMNHGATSQPASKPAVPQS